MFDFHLLYFIQFMKLIKVEIIVKDKRGGRLVVKESDHECFWQCYKNTVLSQDFITSQAF